MKTKEIKFEYTKIKDIIIAILFTIYMLVPLLKIIQRTSSFIDIYEYKIMEIIGIIGIYFFTFEIYKKFKNSKDKKKIIKELLPLIILIAYLIWTLISCIFASNKEYAFYGTLNRKEGYITYLIYAGFFLTFFLISSEKIRKYMLNLFVTIAVLNIIIINITMNNVQLLEFFNYIDMKNGVFNNSNHYGYYLLLATMIACILFITEKNKILKILYAVAYLILVYSLIVNNTFGCYLAVSIAIILFLIYCIYNKKYRIFSIISILIFIIMSCTIQTDGKNIVLKNSNELLNDTNSLINNKTQDTNWEKAGSGRAKLWKYGIIIFLEKPILGYGAENLEAEYARYNIEQDRPHNLIIQLATTSGLPGLILYLSGIILILIRGVKKLKESNNIYLAAYFAVIAYLISAMFGNSMYYTSPYLFILLGYIFNKCITKDNETKNIM